MWFGKSLLDITLIDDNVASTCPCVIVVVVYVIMGKEHAKTLLSKDIQ